MVPPSRRVRAPAPAHGSTSLAVLTKSNGRAQLALMACAPLGGSGFARLRIQMQGFPAAAGDAHFTRPEMTGVGAPRNIRIDQQPKTDRSVLTQVPKGNKLDFPFPAFERRSHSEAVGQRC
jgi:hypothetical protein